MDLVPRLTGGDRVRVGVWAGITATVVGGVLPVFVKALPPRDDPKKQVRVERTVDATGTAIATGPLMVTAIFANPERVMFYEVPRGECHARRERPSTGRITPSASAPFAVQDDEEVCIFFWNGNTMAMEVKLLAYRP